jgi:hypothetical protein
VNPVFWEGDYGISSLEGENDLLFLSGMLEAFKYGKL